MDNLLSIAKGCSNEKDNIDLSMISACKKIRRIAKSSNLTLREEDSDSPRRKHLFNYIRFCGQEPIDFIKEYLSHLQPYMIKRYKEQEYAKEILCVLDTEYAISLYIKIDTKQFKEVIVSFHESSKGTVAKKPSPEGYRHEKVPVIAETVRSYVEGTNNYVIQVLMQRGLLALPVTVPAEKCGEVFLVRRSEIELELLTYCNNYISELYVSKLNVNMDEVTIFTQLQEISFSSYNKDICSTISLIIDSLYIQKDTISKRAVDSALMTYTGQLFLTSEDRAELIATLRDKFTISSHKTIDSVLDRIESNIKIVVDTN